MVAKKASAVFKEEEVVRLKEALRSAELNTSGEVVVVMASSSGRYDRPEDIIGFLTSMLALSAAWISFQTIKIPTGEWQAIPRLGLGLPLILCVLIGGFVVGSALASYFPVLRLPFVSSKEKQEEVGRRADECFYRFSIGRTSGGTGILIYVSLYERMVVVRGDKAISAKLTDSDWNDVCQTILRGFKDAAACDGLRDGIAKCGALLSKHFPRAVDDVNELSDELYFID